MSGVRTKIKDIQSEMRSLEVTGRIVRIGEFREIQTIYGLAEVATAILEDETGSIRWNLWRDQINKVKVGDTVRLENVFVRVFRGRCELNMGRNGKITILKRSQI